MAATWAWREDFSAAQRPWSLNAGAGDDPVPLDELLLRRDAPRASQRGLGFLAHDDRGDVAAARRQRLLAERRSRDHISRNISATAAASRATAAARFAQEEDARWGAPPAPARPATPLRRTSTPGPRLGPGLPPPAAAHLDIVTRNREMAAYAPRRSASRASMTSSFVAQSRCGSAASSWGAALGPASEAGDAATPGRHRSYGRAPAYLARFAGQRAADAAAAAAAERAAAEARAVPPGMRAVTAEEREAALHLLEDARREAMAALRALPLATNTPFRTRRREEADARLADIDAAFALFAQPTVYLPAETPCVQAAGADDVQTYSEEDRTAQR